MGKAANKVKGELIDATQMVDLIQTLKDIADNKFFTLTAQKDKFRRFGETFIDFFRMIRETNVDHPLLSNNNETLGILVITIEGSFLGEFNNRILRSAVEEFENSKSASFIAVGEKSAERLRIHTPELKLFEGMEQRGLYETAVVIKDYVVEEIMNGRMGKVIVCYSWPKSFDTNKVRKVKLLPCDELVAKRNEKMSGEMANIIEESSPYDVVGFLSNLWITTRIYEILMDTLIASTSAQAKFLEDSVERMKKEHKKVSLKYRKAKKNDIDTSLRETFSARMMAKK